MAPHSARVTICGRLVMAAAEVAPNGAGAGVPGAGVSGGPVPGPAAVPLVLRKSARSSETATPAGRRSESRTQREPPVQYRSDVCRFGWKSREWTSGCASVSSNTGGVVPAVVRTAAAASPAPSSCHENATIVDQIDEHTGTAGVLIGTTA